MQRSEFAIVGAAVRLPGVSDLDEFRADLRAGTTHFDVVSRAESLASGVREREIDSDTYVPIASTLDDAELFDREFFGMTAAEARATDPQQRLLLTLAHEAMESAGLGDDAGVCGAYTTVSASSYYLDRIRPTLDPRTAHVDVPTTLGNDRDFASTRIAYKLGFTGASVTVQTACSSSLVALHQACLALAYGDLDTALVGGASLRIPQAQGYVFEHGGIASPTGESRPFDERANGTIRGSGGGAVVVRRLDDALANGDNVLAVIAGSAVNNDGDRRMSYGAPSASGQRRALTAALRRANVDPAAVDYIEAHGTGTPLGDPIEFKGIARAYELRERRAAPRYLGAVKANVGHLDVAAGIVGLLKAMLVLRHGEVFPQPGFTAPNPAIDLPKAQFEIATEPVTLADPQHVAVSSFGMGGTNAHVVLRRAPERAASRPSAPSVTVRLSARTDATLADYKRRVGEYLTANADLEVADVATSLAQRVQHPAVWTASVSSLAELIERLEKASSDDTAPETPAGQRVWLPPAPLDEVFCSAPPVEYDDTAANEQAQPNAAELDVRNHLIALMIDELGVDVADDTDFFEAGGESIALVGIVGKLSDLVGFTPDFDAVDGCTRVGEMIAVLEAQAGQGSSANATLLTFGAEDGRRIYFYPPAGGTNFCYAALSTLAPDLSIRAFKATTLAAPSVEEIAAECISLLAQHEDLDRPLLLGGYSFGGNVAYEIARQLEAAGHPAPKNVVMFDSFAPAAFGGLGSGSAAMAEEVERLARSSDVDDLDRFAETWLANNRALSKYRPTGTIGAPITLLRATEPLSAREAETLGIDVDLASDWRSYTSADARTVDVPGGHYTMFADRAHLQVLARTFTDIVED